MPRWRRWSSRFVATTPMSSPRGCAGGSVSLRNGPLYAELGACQPAGAASLLGDSDLREHDRVPLPLLGLQGERAPVRWPERPVVRLLGRRLLRPLRPGGLAGVPGGLAALLGPHSDCAPVPPRRGADGSALLHLELRDLLFVLKWIFFIYIS